MVSFREFLETMKKNKTVVDVYVRSEKPIIKGYIYDVTSDCLALGVTKDKYSAVIPLDKILMVSISGT